MMVAVLLALAPLAMAGCSSSSTTAPAIESTAFASSLGVNLAASTKTADGLYYRDITVGTGATIAAGDSLTVHYVGALANGAVFDSNGAGQTPFKFQVGKGIVIQGWDEGIPGMKVGGVRQLVIPPALGYGTAAVGPIPSNSILVFTVTVVAKL
jgi:peptidylprolyl isomerase